LARIDATYLRIGKRRRADGRSETSPILEEKNMQASNRSYPQWDIKVVPSGESSYVAFLINHDSGRSWILDGNFNWREILHPIPQLLPPPKVPKALKVRKKTRARR
jgi:hypothetical protein